MCFTQLPWLRLLVVHDSTQGAEKRVLLKAAWVLYWMLYLQEELDAMETFDEIAKQKFIRYKDLCEWYLGVVGLNLESNDWHPVRRAVCRVHVT